jgi:hypothetical protein
VVCNLLDTLSFKQIISDQAIFTKDNFILLIYINDLLIASPDLNNIEFIKAEISKQFEIIDNGLITCFLGLDIICQQDRLYISQKDYIIGVLKHFGISDCHLVATLFNKQKVLKLFEGIIEPAEIKIFQEKVGLLI